MIAASELPSMFYLDPGIDTSRLPMKTEFVCVFAPEATVGDGWVLIRFRVVLGLSVHPEERKRRVKFRGVMPISKQPITEAEALEVYEKLYGVETVWNMSTAVTN